MHRRPSTLLTSTLLIVLSAVAALATAPAAPAAAQSRVCGSTVTIPPDAEQRLMFFLRRTGVRYPRAAAGVIWTVHRTGRLPRCYLRKARARGMGWRPGRSLWRVARGRAIGGDRFGNRERRLPLGFRYVEADLDYDGRWRGGAGAPAALFSRAAPGAAGASG